MEAFPSVSVSQLLVRVAQGDKTAFQMVYDQSGSRVFAICFRMMRNRTDAEDVYQEAFVKIWERSWQYDPAKGDGIAWMVTVARRCALDRLRASRPQNVVFDEVVEGRIDRSAVAAADGGNGVDLTRCLGKMRDDFRKTIMLAYVDGLTHEELADTMGKPLGTVKSWLTRGLTQLKECMDA
jgi:RNA polymerase sigma-70 factor, ECF subfamily